MKFLAINCEIHEKIQSVKFDDYMNGRPNADLLLVDCEKLTDLELSNLTEAVRSRYIGFRGATETQKSQLEALGHFDFSGIWDLPDFADELEFMMSDLAQTQGFSMMPDEGAVIVDSFQGEVVRRGRYEMELSGDFGEEMLALQFKRLQANWGKPIYVVPFRRFYNAPGKHHLTFDWEVLEGDVQVRYVIQTLSQKGDELLREDVYSEREGDFTALTHAEFRGQVYLSGSGRVRLGKVWTYKEKYGLGWYQLGDSRKMLETPAGREMIHSLFIPGKRAERLIVGFSGNLSELPHYERQTMAKTGFPVLLFCDLRARGGAFMLGKHLNTAYVQEVMRMIDEKLAMLGLSRRDLIFAGWSMGSFPALYYGLNMQAGTIIAAKPLLHLGRVTGNVEVSYRTEASMISAREYLCGRVDSADDERLDGLVSELLQTTDASQTDIFTFLMESDELDRCEEVFTNDLAGARNVVIERACGFHADKIYEMSQYIGYVLDALSK
ncbi:MAG: hypothetical protein LBI43_02800 [Streptococcaceae bacterium]|jgi:accessory secretory protein Asp2|nr:hypothetical protein [Streptococcaceae bacterium]